MVRIQPGKQAYRAVCKWCAEQRAYNTRPRIAPRWEDGPYIGKEEFGVDLFEAIKTNAARLWCLKPKPWRLN
jgi:hypothetical protein